MENKDLADAVREALHRAEAPGVRDVHVEPFVDALDDDGWRVTVALAGDDQYWTRSNIDRVRGLARQEADGTAERLNAVLPGMTVVQVVEAVDGPTSSAGRPSEESAPENGEGRVASVTKKGRVR